MGNIIHSRGRGLRVVDCPTRSWTTATHYSWAPPGWPYCEAFPYSPPPTRQIVGAAESYDCCSYAHTTTASRRFQEGAKGEDGGGGQRLISVAEVAAREVVVEIHNTKLSVCLGRQLRTDNLGAGVMSRDRQ